MKASDKRTYYCLAFIIAAILTGCKRNTECLADVMSAKASILSISGPGRVQTGEQATITIGVLNKTGKCVQEATADFYNIGFDTLLVTAALRYTDDDLSKDCACKKDSVIYTLLYFKPLDTGTYRILTKADSSATSLDPAEAIEYTITAE